jgi:hypothetical protein
MGGLHRKAQMSEGAQRRAHSVTTVMCLHRCGGRVNPCPIINARA